MSSISKPRAYSKINRQLSNKILLDKVINIANRKKEFGWSEGLNRERRDCLKLFGYKCLRADWKWEEGRRKVPWKRLEVFARVKFFKRNLKGNLSSLI